MGCRFSKSNSINLEIDSDSTNVAAETVNRSLTKTTEHPVDSQSVLTSDTEALNPTTVSDECSVRETTTSTDYMKNTYSPVHWGIPVRDRITLRPKKSIDTEVQKSIALYVNKPIKQVESASQADFFRMLDEKIAQ
ncbi:unnamed protein product, partial [Onchocerca ochengi]|uniref:INCENP_ARK-bind domain-containing protein n=1 Tax=Onchocerca ochengi TaxID=42157 RepID=A0A182EMQ1_ONCOC